MKYRSINVGDFVENLAQNTSFAPDFDLDLLAGRHIVMLFAGTLQSAIGIDALDRLKELPIFNGNDAVLLVVMCANSEDPAAIAQLNSRGIGVVYDYDFRMSRHFGAAPVEAEKDAEIRYRQIICTLNPRMQVDSIVAIDKIDQAIASIARLDDPAAFLGFEVFAPILVIPNVFEAELRGGADLSVQ